MHGEMYTVDGAMSSRDKSTRWIEVHGISDNGFVYGETTIFFNTIDQMFKFGVDALKESIKVARKSDALTDEEAEKGLRVLDMLHRALNGEIDIRIVETFDVEQVEMEVGTSVGGTDAEEDITKYL
jgi:hypothetical protein